MHWALADPKKHTQARVAEKTAKPVRLHQEFRRRSETRPKNHEIGRLKVMPGSINFIQDILPDLFINWSDTEPLKRSPELMVDTTRNQPAC